MGDVIGFVSRGDTRIARELSGLLPNQSALVDYLDRAIRQHRGTVFTARRIGELLAADPDCARIVARSSIARLGVHTDKDAMVRLTSALEPLRPLPIDKATMLRVRLRYPIDQIPKGANLRTLEEMNLRAPHGSNTDPDDLIAFMSIFLCALAMLAGVTVDPRGQVDSHATG